MAQSGTMVPVTIVSAEPNVITQIKTQEKDGYDAIALGYGRKVNDVTEKIKGNLHRKFQYIKEVKVADPTQYKKDQELSVNVFEGITSVSVRGISKGKGYAGVVKRHHFKAGPRTHGAKMQRNPGSNGTRKPRRTKPGKRQAGHMGVDTITLHDIPVVGIDAANNLIALKGPLPGSINSLVTIWVPLDSQLKKSE